MIPIVWFRAMRLDHFACAVRVLFVDEPKDLRDYVHDRRRPRPRDGTLVVGVEHRPQGSARRFDSRSFFVQRVDGVRGPILGRGTGEDTALVSPASSD